MASGGGVNQGKSAFLEEFLPGNRDAGIDAVNSAWSAAGNQGTISESLFGKIRSDLGLTGKRGRKGSASNDTDGSKAKGKARPKGAKGKAASKTEEAPSQPNGRETDKGPSRSAFVEEVLGREPGANLKTVNDAWASAGHEGSISPSIFYKIKRELGEAGGGTPAAAVTSGPEADLAATQPAVEARPELYGETVLPPVSGSESGDRERVLDRVEDGIDDLIIELKRLGGMEEALEAMRKVRRVVVRSHQG